MLGNRIGFIRDPLTMGLHIPSVPSNLHLEGQSALQSKRFCSSCTFIPFQIDPPLSFNIALLAPWLYLIHNKFLWILVIHILKVETEIQLKEEQRRFNPWEILEAIDYVVLKLDIDKTRLEKVVLRFIPL